MRNWILTTSPRKKEDSGIEKPKDLSIKKVHFLKHHLYFTDAVKHSVLIQEMSKHGFEETPLYNLTSQRYCFFNRLPSIILTRSL